MNRPISFIVLQILLLTGIARAQIDVNIYNVTEEQIGNLPDTDPEDLTSTYNQTNVSLFYRNLEVGLRTEYFNSSYRQSDFDSIPVTQRYVRWYGGNWEATFGNFYGILGRGLIFRAFELTGVINEDTGFRRRYQLSRDNDAVIFRSSTKFLEVTALHGKPIINDFPPGHDRLKQRGSEASGGEIKLLLHPSLNVGTTYMNVDALDLELSSASI